MRNFQIILFAVFVVSCGYNDVAPSAEELLTSAENGWVVTAATVSPGVNFFGMIITDYYLFYESCDKDDAMIFTSDGKYKVSNSMKCDPTEPSILETGSWTLTSDKKIITIDPVGARASEAEIVELTDSIFRISLEEELDGILYTLIVTHNPK